MGWNRYNFADATIDDFRKVAELHVEALNHAIADIPADRVRLHLCWGNFEGPHIRDIPLARILDIVLKANVGAISFEAANPRHAHEWKVFEGVKLPDGKILIPGVLDSTTNFVEHPELVAERIVRYAKLVGPGERDRRDGLRLLDVRALGADGPPDGHLGQVPGDGRGRPDRQRAALV